MKKACLLAVVLCFFPFYETAQAASFDCSKSTTRVERLICSNKEISLLDDQLGELYSPELMDEFPKIRSAQKAWVARRNQCTDTQCLRIRYQDRLFELACDNRISSQGSSRGAGQCTWFKLVRLERKFPRLLDLRVKELSESAESYDRANIPNLVNNEHKAWLAYRDASCALQGWVEGGTDGWKNTNAAFCELEATEKRIYKLRRELGAK